MTPLENVTVTAIKSLVTVASSRDETWIMKCRPSYGLSFCKEGQITYIQQGKKYISNKDVAVLLPEGQTYSLHRYGRGVFPLVNFYTAEPISDIIQVFPISDAASYIADFENMHKLSLFPKNRAKVMSIFYNILHRITMQQNVSYSVFAPIARYVEEHYTDPELSNGAIADYHGISEVYLRRLFLEKYGKTPRKYVIDLRINRAKQLLSDGVLSIGEISESCGFSNPYHFSRSFKAHVGITPSDFMQKNKTVAL